MDDSFKDTFITINLTERGEMEVQVSDYVTAKTGDLINFGYTDLTEEEVLNVVHIIVSGEKSKDIIYNFIKDDIVIPEPES